VEVELDEDFRGTCIDGIVPLVLLPRVSEENSVLINLLRNGGIPRGRHGKYRAVAFDETRFRLVPISGT
jgi:hypothetical protein